MKNIIIAILGLIIVGGGVYFATKNNQTEYSAEPDVETKSETDNVSDTETPEVPGFTVKEKKETDESKTVIGTSAGGFDITAFHYGTGEKEILFVGGIHGGYAWNTVLVARELMNYLENHPEVIPENTKVTVIPLLNPDGLNETVGTTGEFDETDVPVSQEKVVAGRFNANKVDLNRNFDCNWKSTGVWKNREVSGGEVIFSEPESKAMRTYVEKSEPSAVIAWYSSAGGVYSASCQSDILEETSEITSIYADASGYPAYEEFDSYEVNGDMVNWVAKKGIPAISVLLTTSKDVEWDKNRSGVEALLKYYTE